MDHVFGAIVRDEIYKYMLDRQKIQLDPKEDLVTFFMRKVSERIKEKDHDVNNTQLRTAIENELIIIHQHRKFKFIV